MKVFSKFEQNLEYLGFEMAPVAWDLARFPFQSDDHRIALLEELTANKEAATGGVEQSTGVQSA